MLDDNERKKHCFTVTDLENEVLREYLYLFRATHQVKELLDWQVGLIDNMLEHLGKSIDY